MYLKYGYHGSMAHRLNMAISHHGKMDGSISRHLSMAFFSPWKYGYFSPWKYGSFLPWKYGYFSSWKYGYFSHGNIAVFLAMQIWLILSTEMTTLWALYSVVSLPLTENTLSFFSFSFTLFSSILTTHFSSNLLRRKHVYLILRLTI